MGHRFSFTLGFSLVIDSFLGDVHVQVILGQISFVDSQSRSLDLDLDLVRSFSPGADHVRCFLR